MGSQPSAMVRYLSHGDVSLALETRGFGTRRVIFVHGWSGSRRLFYDVANLLDPAAFTLGLLDMRGSGLSDRPAHGHDLIGYASDLRIALEQAGPAVTLVAHSSGATIAQFVAIDPPANLSNLILLAPEPLRIPASCADQRELGEKAFGSRTAIEGMIRSLTYRDVSPETLERVIDDAVTTQREAWLARVVNERTSTLTRRSQAISLPTVIVCGANDIVATPALIRRDLTRTIPTATFVTFKDAGHYVPIELPRKVASVIDEHAVAARPEKLGREHPSSNATRSG